MSRYFLTNNFFKNRNSFIFLDRDGVLIIKQKKGEYVKSLNQFVWRKGSLEAIRFLGKKNKKIIIISNQAGIALNKVKLEDLNIIHNHIINKSLKLGANIEDIIFCPHHWNDNCSCRKPKSGMFYHAQKKFDIDLTMVDRSDWLDTELRGQEFLTIEEQRREAICKNLKREPLLEYIKSHSFKIWISGIRKDQTDARSSIQFIDVTDLEVIKLSPLFAWSKLDVRNLLIDNDLKINSDYFDLCKFNESKECGLHF